MQVEVQELVIPEPREKQQMKITSEIRECLLTCKGTKGLFKAVSNILQIRSAIFPS